MAVSLSDAQDGWTVVDFFRSVGLYEIGSRVGIYLVLYTTTQKMWV